MYHANKDVIPDKVAKNPAKIRFAIINYELSHP
jgi:hypothetical protein